MPPRIGDESELPLCFSPLFLPELFFGDFLAVTGLPVELTSDAYLDPVTGRCADTSSLGANGGYAGATVRARTAGADSDDPVEEPIAELAEGRVDPQPLGDVEHAGSLTLGRAAGRGVNALTQSPTHD